MTKDDFQLWLADPMTTLVFAEINQRREELKEQLVRTAGTDPAQDKYIAGMAHAFNTILDMSYEEVTDE